MNVKRKFFFILALMICCLPSFKAIDNGISAQTSQQKASSVTGRVKDTKGEPVIGASVRIKGTTTGTITDVDGNFTLPNVHANATLVISYIGMTSQDIALNNRKSIDVTLQESAVGMNEVVVVGYGTQKRSDITGSVTSVSKDRLSNLPVANLFQSIQGVAAGVNVTQNSSIPGDASSVLVRGKNSVSLSNSPLLVVDGVAMSMDASVNDINPNDIESIEILKDASGVAIYGVQGSNGVILVTTKRGNSASPKIRYGGYVGFSEIAHILKPGSTSQLLERYAEYARIQVSPLNPDYGGVRYANEVDNFKAGKTTDWIDEATQEGVIQNHNISVSGGSQNAKYYIAGDFLDQKGVVKGYNYKRYSMRVNMDVNPTKYFTLGTSSSIVAHNRDGGRSNLLNASAMSPYAKEYNDDGTYTQYPMYSETLWSNPMLSTTLNPERRSFDIFASGYGELNLGEIYAPLKGLKYRLNANYTYIPSRNNYYEGKTVYNQQGYGYIDNQESQYYLIENILTYTKDIKKHHFDLTGLFSASSKYWQDSRASSRTFPNDNLGWGNLESGSTQSVESQADMRRLQSWMGRLNYNFDSRYLFTATLRRDASSVFGDNSKWGNFPSFAVGWNVTREKFAAPFTAVLNNLKLRTSWGYSGNASLDVYSSLSQMVSNSLAMNGGSTTALKVGTPSQGIRMGNPNLHWERTKSFNIAADFGLWSNRIYGTIEYYSRTTDGILLRQNLTQVSGYENVYNNIGTINNKGIEITLNSTNINTKNFRWNSTIVFAKNTNKWVEVYGNGVEDLNNRWFIGKPLGVIYDYTKVGIWQESEIGKPKAQGGNIGWDDTALAGDLKLADLNNDGKIDDKDRSILGQTDPKWTGGLTNTFSYKNFNLSIFVQTSQGAKGNNSVIGTAADEIGRRNGPAEVGFWTPTNKSNEWRSLGNHSNSHGYGFPCDASYTRIKDVTVSYNVPSNALTKLGLSAAQIYVSGRNLYTFTNWVGWDPEARYDGRGSGNWDINYPVTRDVVVGLNVTF